MISIVICSASAEDLAAVRSNIELTIGVPFELLAIDNRSDRRGICEVYNEGARRAQHDCICFMHEDIEIRTVGWGQLVLDIFKNHEDVGVLGVAGGGYKSLSPSGWYQLEFQSEERSYQNLLQGFKYDQKTELHAYTNPRNEQLSQVVCVDGLWFCTRREIALQYPFDAQLLRGFHGYDLDFCLSVFPKYKIVVTYGILMKHASEGNFNKEWLNEILKLHRKWSYTLPLTTSQMTEGEIYLTEKRSFKRLIEQMMRWDYSFGQIHRMLVHSSKTRRVSRHVIFKAYLHLLKLTFRILRLPDVQIPPPISA